MNRSQLVRLPKDWGHLRSACQSAVALATFWGAQPQHCSISRTGMNPSVIPTGCDRFLRAVSHTPILLFWLFQSFKETCSVFCRCQSADDSRPCKVSWFDTFKQRDTQMFERLDPLFLSFMSNLRCNRLYALTFASIFLKEEVSLNHQLLFNQKRFYLRLLLTNSQRRA